MQTETINQQNPSTPFHHNYSTTARDCFNFSKNVKSIRSIICGAKASQMSKTFTLHSKFKPAGDQPQAIEQLKRAQDQQALLLGVTGSGKTFTLANVIASQERQVLILSPNKTLAAQLYEEFCSFFPQNKVCYFVSYFDYYQPESYIPSTDTYVAKETRINSDIERLRVETTAALQSRPDVIVIASVSAIYSLGNPEDFRSQTLCFTQGQPLERRDLLEKILAIQYQRNDIQLDSGQFRLIGNQVTINLPYLHSHLRLTVNKGILDKIELLDKRHMAPPTELDAIQIFPAKHFVTPPDRLKPAILGIRSELEQRLATINDPVIKSRLQARINQDLAMMATTGYCAGIENYTAYFDNRPLESRPYCLFDFFNKDFLLIIDESHIAIPQLGAMYHGDRARKKTLVEYGFRLPSAMHNRPLQFSEIEPFFSNTIFVSATPATYELEHASVVAEQIVRPTGILDPIIQVLPRDNQLQDLLNQIKATTKLGFRTLVLTLTKKMAEELALFLEQHQIKVCYMHADIKTPMRTELLNKLRNGDFDALVGINLLREGLDLPEVALVAILDADIAGFLRNAKSLIQIIGRAARNISSRVLLYADQITPAMKEAMEETERRRQIQIAHNQHHNITPENTQRSVTKSISSLPKPKPTPTQPDKARRGTDEHRTQSIEKIEKQMLAAAKKRDFAKAIELRELLKKLKQE